MSDQFSQIILTLSDQFAEVARADQQDPSLQPLMNVMQKHNATIENVLDQCEWRSRELNGTRVGALFKKFADNPQFAAQAKNLFDVNVNRHFMYDKQLADSIEADLAPITGAGQIVEHVHQIVQPKSVG